MNEWPSHANGAVGSSRGIREAGGLRVSGSEDLGGSDRYGSCMDSETVED